MSQTIIHYFELVDIDEQDREGEIGMASRDSHCSLQAIKKKSPVRQIGQGVMERIMRQCLFGSLALGDVAVDDDQTFVVAVCSTNGAGSGLKNAPRAILVADTIFKPLPPARQAGFLGGLEHASAVVGMDLFGGGRCV